MPNSTMFANASAFHTDQVAQINTGRFDQRDKRIYQGNYSSNVQINTREYHVHATRPSTGLKELHRNIAVEALHNSAQRCDAPKCHEETRKAVQADIFSWVTDEKVEDGGPMQVLWLSGPAGSGKTAIMGTMCDRFKGIGRLAATFFFSSSERQSKHRLVTTLAYQLQQHPSMESHISSKIATAIDKDPAIFNKNLKEQMEVLILEPLRQSQYSFGVASIQPLVIAIDGLDECGGSKPDDSYRSKEDDQVEILSTLLHATNDPAFPFRIIIASRPEHHIRSYLDAAGDIIEIFLDNKYNPDADIALFLKSRFAEIRRRYTHLPATWPTESDIAALVDNASGQFIYAATIIRFLHTPPKLPQDQLNIILGPKGVGGSNPFTTLDALYTSVLLSSPDPDVTVLWLQAHQVIQREVLPPTSVIVPAWFFDRFFESTAGQAQMLFGIPSLIHLAERKFTNPKPPSVSDAIYAFYHKSFLDFLEDPSRCKAVSNIGRAEAREWLRDRIGNVLKAGGPEVPFSPSLPESDREALMSYFNTLFVHLWDMFACHPSGSRTNLPSLGTTLPIKQLRKPQPLVSPKTLSKCDPALWLGFRGLMSDHLRRDLFFMVHNDCRMYRPCTSTCKRWRKAMSRLPNELWNTDGYSFTLVLERFCIVRPPLRTYYSAFPMTNEWILDVEYWS
ncbi:hypothetical protein FA13DRAFT_1816058 [Coprinellus micaceus]|uniref:Nephrocystin 3-like N-terminal domain-containing protein n=1 Tax=Coprinellus micaceus TaxID=71717 RepID=A0A4Y7T3A9_COPMI|nr:hypothetical protein FA13DRAFT_1816058 [Coprinellus micaceus]